jgi:hypothetical protein
MRKTQNNKKTATIPYDILVGKLEGKITIGGFRRT